MDFKRNYVQIPSKAEPQIQFSVESQFEVARVSDSVSCLPKLTNQRSPVGRWLQSDERHQEHQRAETRQPRHQHLSWNAHVRCNRRSCRGKKRRAWTGLNPEINPVYFHASEPRFVLALYELSLRLTATTGATLFVAISRMTLSKELQLKWTI